MRPKRLSSDWDLPGREPYLFMCFHAQFVQLGRMTSSFSNGQLGITDTCMNIVETSSITLLFIGFDDDPIFPGAE